MVQPLVHPSSTTPSIWHLPSVGFIKINVDAAFPLSSDHFYVGLIARDANSRCLWWYRRSFWIRLRPIDGEAMPILFGVRAAKNHGWSNVYWNLIGLHLVQVLQNASSSMSFYSFGALLEECLALNTSFQSLTFSFV